MIRFISESELIFVTQETHISVSHIEISSANPISQKKKENKIKRKKEGNVYNFCHLVV